MALPPAETTQSAPSLRSFPFIAPAGDLAYLWGGEGDTDPGSVFIYSVKIETWTRKVTKDQHPPLFLGDGACCVADQHFYLYGGHDRSLCHGALFQLNLAE